MEQFISIAVVLINSVLLLYLAITIKAQRRLEKAQGSLIKTAQNLNDVYKAKLDAANEYGEYLVKKNDSLEMQVMAMKRVNGELRLKISQLTYKK